MSEHQPRPGERRHVWDDPANVRRLVQWFIGSCVGMFLLDAVVHRHASFEHGELPVETWFGFYSIYGFVACVLLVVLAKQMRKVLMRPEDYYESRLVGAVGEESDTAGEEGDAESAGSEGEGGHA